MINKKSAIKKSLIIIGSCLLVASIVLLCVWQWNIHTYEQKAREYVKVIKELVPQSQENVPAERRDNAMSTLDIDGIDFVGILEIPQHESILPVGADWGNSSKYPCRFSGSVYDRTICIGATSQKGQYDFYRDISVGDNVLFTDMEGNRYSYAVTDICYENNADQTTLQQKEASLTLFIKNVYAFEYIIIYCDVLS